MIDGGLCAAPLAEVARKRAVLVVEEGKEARTR
jgi:hypothetical protein